ncbi:MAG: DNA primase [Deltaproteobacteria bacterium]|nr:MAG: DNA primase [Deltaproteobacteria bacterium]
MANFIPEDKISEIRNAVDIVDIISDSVLLKKSGRNYIGLCPFHSEKTPSFTVSPEKQIFHCFGCGEGGNVFTYLMKQHGFTFPEAAKTLASRYGVEIPTHRLSPQQKRRIGERENLLSINKQALGFFCNALHKSASGRKALGYLKKRGLTKDTINDFKLGYALGGWDKLVNYFNKEKISSILVEKSGLIISRKGKPGFYDRFRDRIIFPIFDSNQQVIGFGGRVMDESLPKYLNSPETALYNKSRSLYGLYHAKNPCREARSVYIVEGYFDLLTLYQNGIQNSVATLGTALTEEHVRSLKGLIGENGKFILVYDSDDAGIKAAQRSIEVFDKSFVDAQILILDAGSDPDSDVFQFGAEKFIKAAAERALGIIPFLIESAINKHDLSIEGKIRILSDLKQPLAALKDSLARSLYIKELAERIGVEEKAVLEKIKEASEARATMVRRPLYLSKGETNDKGSNNISGMTLHQKKEHRMERQIITMLLQFPEIIPEINDRGVLEYFEDLTLKAIGSSIIKYEQTAGSFRHTPVETEAKTARGRVSEIMTFIDDVEKERIVAALSSSEDSWDIEGCVKLINQFIEASRGHHDKNSIEKRIQEAERRGDQELLTQLLSEKQQLAVSKQKQKMSSLYRK